MQWDIQNLLGEVYIVCPSYPTNELLLMIFKVAIWLTLNKLGSVIAGAIQLALNAKTNTKGSISPQTYLVLVALQCLGLPLSLLISPARENYLF
jgi:hypothetical protein